MGFGNICSRLIYGCNISDYVNPDSDSDNESDNESRRKKIQDDSRVLCMGTDEDDVYIFTIKSLKGGGIWDSGGRFTIEEIQDLILPNAEEEFSKFLKEYGLEEHGLKLSFGLYMSFGQGKY